MHRHILCQAQDKSMHQTVISQLENYFTNLFLAQLLLHYLPSTVEKNTLQSRNHLANSKPTLPSKME